MSDLLSLINSNSLAGTAGVGEPQRYNSIVLAIPGSVNKGDVLTLGLQSFNIPKMLGMSNAIQIQRGLTSKKFAGNVQFDQLTVEFKDYVDRPTLAQLVQWRAQVFNPYTKQVGAATLYKRDCEVFLFPPVGSLAAVRSIILKGVWPDSIDTGNADVSSDESVNIQTNFQYDECLPGQGFDQTSFLLSAGISLVSGALSAALQVAF